MSDTSKFNPIVSFLWSIADLLNGAFKKSEFQKIVLPFTVLRRLDYALEATKAKVLDTEHDLKEKGLENRHGQLCRASGYAFYNTSKLNYEGLLHDDANLALNLRQYVMGFSPNVREIFDAFNFDDSIRDLEKVNLLYLLMERFNEKSKVDLRPSALSNHEMGYVFEHLLRKFNEALNENPGEHFTPRDAIRLMVDLVLMLDTELGSGEGVARTVNDCCCGTGGILSISKERILQVNPRAKVHLYGQELNPFTWAIARADMLILEPEGKDAENIKLGSTLSNDQLTEKRFDLQFVNPPYGYEWSKDEAAVTAEAARGFGGRFGAGLPRKSDGQMLFLEHFIARMNDPKESQSYIGIIMNGSPLFTGGAGSGESEIRRWIFENDWLEAIVALPNQIFYNTGIATYIWLLSNRKPVKHKGKVMMVDASGEEFWSKMSKNLGSKSREITDTHKQAILELVKAREEGPHVKIFDTTDFGYREIKVLRPLKLRFEINAESIDRLDAQVAFKNLATSKKKDRIEHQREILEGQALQTAIRSILQALPKKAYTQRDAFTADLENLLKYVGLKLKAPVLKAILAGIGERDDAAEICRDSDGNPEPDTDLNDTENVPLKEKVETYFAREVAPHVPDAWIDPAFCDAKDGKVGRVGFEIPFNRHFYVFQPPRPLSAIDADLKASTDRILTMIGGAYPMSFPRYPKYKASGVEWLGDVPEHWSTVRYKNVFTEKRSASGGALPSGSISFGRVVFKTDNVLNELTKATYQEVLSGEFLINPINLNYDLKSLRTGLSGINTCVSPAYIVLRSNSLGNKSYLKYQLHVFDVLHMKTLGAGVRQTITFGDIGTCPTYIPPLPEQTAIAEFLDRETGKIDGLVAEQRQLMELLKEKRQAVISHAVTKGLNPHAHMKPSGIEWLGDVPDHWEVRRIRHFAEVLRGKFTHRPRNDPSFYGGEFPFVQTGDITASSRYITGFKQTLNERGVEVSKEFPKGTLVMAIAANIGDVAILDFPAYFPDSIVGLVPKRGVELLFLYYLMIAMKQPMLMTATVSTQMNLNIDQICSLTAAAPPCDEQQAIVAHLDTELAKFDTLTAEAQRAIDLLQERRTALISAAVTGQIDVRHQPRT